MFKSLIKKIADKILVPPSPILITDWNTKQLCFLVCGRNQEEAWNQICCLESGVRLLRVMEGTYYNMYYYELYE